VYPQIASCASRAAALTRARGMVQSEQENGSRSRLLRAARTVAVIFFWYLVSASIILATKWVMSGKGPAWHRFPYPLTIATFANTAVTIWAYLVSRLPGFRAEPLSDEQFRVYVLPIGASTAMEIGFSNVALLLLTVSFGTILKGAAPVFTMMWGIMLGVEAYSVRLSLTVLVIAGGITLASIGEGKDFVLLGFILQVSATALGGLRWAMTHKLLKGSPTNLMPPNTAILYTSPATAFFILPFATLIEFRRMIRHLVSFSFADFLKLLAVLFIISTLIFILLISEYWLVHDTSSLGLSVAGVFKECMTIGGGLLLFHEHLTPLNILGFFICQLGIAAYITLRYDSGDHHIPPPFDMNVEEGVNIPLASSVLRDEEDW
jgi:solute carrier family 35, member C2